MPTLNMRLSQPRLLIDINRLDVLAGISLDGNRVRIGALPRHAMAASSPIIIEHLPLIAEAMPHVAHVAVRNRGTFGGSIALADPAAEMPACILALDAILILQSTAGRPEVWADAYFHGLYETAQRPKQLLVEVLIPVQQSTSVSVFMELARRHGDFAIAGIALQLVVERDIVADARLVYFASENKPTLAHGARATIVGRRIDEMSANAVASALEDELVGAFNLFHQEVRQFTDKQIELVKNFAAQAVIAIENSRLLNDLNKLNQQLEQRVVDQVGEIER